MTFKFIFMMLFLSSACFATSFSFGESIEVNNKNELLDLVLQNANYCIEQIVNEQIYLKPKKIFNSREGVFLKLNRFYLVRLECLHSNERGCYISSLRQGER
jgi:hypothetical protein